MTTTEENSKAADEKLDRIRSRLEINNALILSIATLSITWCSYQGTLWDGIQTFKLAESNKCNRLAQETKLLAVQQKAMDEGVVINFVHQVVEEKTNNLDFYLQRLRPELANVLHAWVASKPLENPAAPPHPMATEEYKALMKKEMAEADSLLAIADDYWDQAEKANTYSDRYSLFTVVFSMVMFLGAITTKMTHIRLSFTLIVASGCICILILVFLFISLPVARE